MEITQKFKLMKPNRWKKDRLNSTIIRFKECTNEWIKAIEQLGEYPNRKNVHRYAYKEIRAKFQDLHANLVQEAMNRAIETYRAYLKNGGSLPEFNANIISYKVADVRLNKHFIGIPLPKERVWLPLNVPPKLRGFLNHEHGRVQISYTKGEYHACISFKIDEPESYEPQGWIGLDIGINHIVVVSDSKGRINKFYNNAISWKKEMDCRRDGLRRLNDKDVKDTWRVLKRMSDKVKNRMSYINHVIAKELVEIAKHRRYGIAVEGLKDLRKRRGKTGKRHRKRLHKWAYRDLIAKIDYKAKLNGVPFEFVDPRNTTRTCSNCGYIKSRVTDRWFKCPQCGFQLDRDLNAARNISRILEQGLRIPLSPKGHELPA